MTFLLAVVLAATQLVNPPAPVQQTFRNGETLDYTVTWMRISGGTARMTISSPNEETYRLTSVAKSGAAFSRFVKVRDEIESTVSRENFTTLKYVKRLDEKGEKKVETTTVEDGVATRKRKKIKTVRVPTPVYDPLSVMYHLRTLDLTVGAKHELTLVADAKLYNVHVNVRRKEKIQTPAGLFDTVMVEPTMESGGVEREERLFIWYTDDERRIPVRIRTEVKIGAITATLTKVTSGVESIDPPQIKGQ
ncbi:MAG TPA: DUF3108 domain-containing protein [Thermoanaerobaculia bacterium]